MSTITKKIEGVRAQIAAHQAQLDEPANTSMSRAEVSEELHGYIDTLHDDASDLMLDRIRRNAAGASIDLLTPEFNELEDTRGAVDTLAKETRAWLVLALGKEGMLARFKHLLDEMPEGIDAEGRAKKTADLREQLAALELKEEQHLLAADAEGIDWDPRPGQRPEFAILMGHGDV